MDNDLQGLPWQQKQDGFHPRLSDKDSIDFTSGFAVFLTLMAH